MKKIALILVFAMVLALVSACQPAQTQTTTAGPSTSSSTTSAFVKHKVGYNDFGRSAFVLSYLEGNVKYGVEAYGNEFLGTDDNFTMDNIITDLQNELSAGCDAIAFWSPIDSIQITAANICKNAKAPFVLPDKVPMDQSVLDQLQLNEYFVGAIGPDNYATGKAMGEIAVANGMKTCIIVANPAGDASGEPKIKGLTEVLTANGGSVLSISHSVNTTEAITKCEDQVAAYPDADFIYGCGSDFSEAVLTVMAKHTDSKMKLYLNGYSGETIAALQSGKAVALNDDMVVAGIFGAVLLQNFLNGTPILDKDGKKPIISAISALAIEPQQADLFKKLFIDNRPYSVDELKAMLGISYDDFMKIIHDFNLENRAQAALKSGLITQADLTAAGLS